MMDDIIDLELEKVELIITKIEPIPRTRTFAAWNSNSGKRSARWPAKGRRTGLGITAEGDMLAALGSVTVRTRRSAFAVEVQKTWRWKPTAHR